MTTNRLFADSEGDFGKWNDHPATCERKVPVGEEPLNRALKDDRPKIVCGAKVQWRSWESSDGGYEDYQYRCERDHTWWIDGPDA